MNKLVFILFACCSFLMNVIITSYFKDEKQILERRLANTEADLQQKLSSCQEVLYILHCPLNA